MLVPYYQIFSWLLAMLTGMLFAFVGGSVVVGENDDNVAKYIRIPPGWSERLFMLKNHYFGTYFRIAYAWSCATFLLLAISSNKVEGMAVGKLLIAFIEFGFWIYILFLQFQKK